MVTMSDILYTWTSICMSNVRKIGSHCIRLCDLAFQKYSSVLWCEWDRGNALRPLKYSSVLWCEWDRGNALRPLQNFPQSGLGFSQNPNFFNCNGSGSVFGRTQVLNGEKKGEIETFSLSCSRKSSVERDNIKASSFSHSHAFHHLSKHLPFFPLFWWVGCGSSISCWVGCGSSVCCHLFPCVNDFILLGANFKLRYLLSMNLWL